MLVPNEMFWETMHWIKFFQPLIWLTKTNWQRVCVRIKTIRGISQESHWKGPGKSFRGVEDLYSPVCTQKQQWFNSEQWFTDNLLGVLLMIHLNGLKTPGQCNVQIGYSEDCIVILCNLLPWQLPFDSYTATAFPQWKTVSEILVGNALGKVHGQ
jgi:hypothetical protein